MKKIYALLFAVMFALTASAQISWNVKGGIGLSTIDFDDYGSKPALVGKFGIGMEKMITHKWSIIPSLELALKGGAGSTNGLKYSATYIQIPVMASYLLTTFSGGSVSLKAGPYAAYKLTGRFKEDDDHYGGHLETDFDFGVIGGVDFNFQRFVLGLEYEYGFTHIDTNGRAHLEKFSNSAAYLTLGYKF